MMRNRSNVSGFTLIEAILSLLSITVIGFGGYYVYSQHLRNKTTPQNIASKNIPSVSVPTTASPHSYTGWNTYCDPVNKYCFDYPPAYKFLPADPAQLASGYTHVKLLNFNSPYGADSLDYTNPITVDPFRKQADTTGSEPFYAISVNNIYASDSPLKVVGGCYTYELLCFYEIVDSSKFGIPKVGQWQQFPNEALLSNLASHTNTYGDFTAGGSGAIKTLNDARKWFSTANAKTYLLILESLRVN
jgi:hypothetical protein